MQLHGFDRGRQRMALCGRPAIGATGTDVMRCLTAGTVRPCCQRGDVFHVATPPEAVRQVAAAHWPRAAFTFSPGVKEVAFSSCSSRQVPF